MAGPWSAVEDEYGQLITVVPVSLLGRDHGSVAVDQPLLIWRR